MGSELSWILDIPVPCGHCGKEFPERAARLVGLEQVDCPSCGAVLDLNTGEWPSFRKRIEEFSVGKFAPVAQVQKLPERG